MSRQVDHRPVEASGQYGWKPTLIEDPIARMEAEQHMRDPLLVRYFSMFFMNVSRKLLKRLPWRAAHADFPLLLRYGLDDHIVGQRGCDLIFAQW